MLLCLLLYAKIQLLFYQFSFIFIMFSHLLYTTREQIDSFRNFVAQNLQNIELITPRLMLEVGFKLHLCGATYLQEAINYYYSLPPKSRINFNGQIYPHIAEKFDSVARNVDRDIRTAIKRCYESGRLFALNELFGCEIVSRQYMPTNTEFVVNVARWIKTYKSSQTINN